MGKPSDDLSAEVGNRYVSALRLREHPLASDEATCDERRSSAAKVVKDVVAALNGSPAPGPDPDEVRATIARFLNSGMGVRTALEANQVLFSCALPVLVEHLDTDPIEIATELNHRLARDVSVAMGEAGTTGMLQPTTIQALDRRRLPVGFTKREMQVLAELVSGADRDEICARMHISKKTLQNHISHISDKLQGRGRRGIIEGARALHAIIAVPAVVVSVALGDGITALRDFT